MGQLVPNPQPVPPSFPIWAAHAGETYVLFIDETFSQFFELNQRGYFCYGAVGIPEGEHAAVSAEFAPILEKYRQLLVPELSELKHTEFKRIPFTERWDLARAIRDVLYAHGCFVSGFYTPARSFLLERVRTTIVDDLPSVPVDHAALLQQEITELRDRSNREPGQSALLQQLLALPVSSGLNAVAGLNCKVRIVYDSREKKEDRALKAAIERLVEGMPNVWERLGGRFVAFNEAGISHDEFGLQIADIVAGETRAFLDANPDLLEYGASPRIITQATDEPSMAVDRINGNVWKTGVVTQMYNALSRRFFNKDPKARSVLPCFTDVMLAGTLTCYSSWGTPRHLMYYEGLIFDQTDK